MGKREASVIPDMPLTTRTIFRGAAPIFIGMSSAMFASWTDTTVASFFGDAAIASVGIAGFVFFLLFSLSIGLANAVQSYTGTALGRGGDDRQAPLAHGIALGLATALLLTAAALLFAGPLVRAVSTDPEVVRTTILYLAPLSCALPFYYFNAVCRGYLTATGRAWCYTRANLTIQAVNLVGSLVLAFGLFGLPRLGVLGIGIATFLAYGAGAAVNLRALATHLGVGGLRALPASLDVRFAAGFARHALLSGLGQALYAAGWIASFAVVGHLGTESLAAYHIAAQLSLVAVYLSNAFGSLAIATVARLEGGGHGARARAEGMKIVRLAVAIVVLYAVVVTAVAEPLLGFLLDGSGSPEAFVPAVQVFSLALPVHTLGTVLGHALQGLHLYGFVLRVSAFTQWCLFLPAAYLLGPVAGWGLAGVALAEIAYRGGMAGLYLRRWRRGDGALPAVRSGA
jgi:MATE family multidrug resistance protein